MTKYYVDTNGKFLGGFDGGAVPPEGSIEVTKLPDHGSDIWSFSNNKFEPDPTRLVELDKKDKKDKAAEQLMISLARLVLGEALKQEDIDAANDYLNN